VVAIDVLEMLSVASAHHSTGQVDAVEIRLFTTA